MAIVREAKTTDIPRILELYRQLAMNPGELEAIKAEPEFGKKMFQEITNLKGYHLLVAEVNGEVVGTTVFVILPGLAHGISHWGVVEFMVADEAHRSQGISQALMDYAAELAEEPDAIKSCWVQIRSGQMPTGFTGVRVMKPPTKDSPGIFVQPDVPLLCHGLSSLGVHVQNTFLNYPTW